jgi:hypothetical protein
MAKTALTQLQDQIEAIRRESYAEGYAAAMQAVRDFAARPAALPAVPAAPRPAAAVRAPAAHARGRAPAKKAAPAAAKPAGRPQRGTNAKLVETVLQSIAPRAARPTEIRKAIQRDQGVAIPFTSIRHALGQLEARRMVEQVANSKTWRYLAPAAARG